MKQEIIQRRPSSDGVAHDFALIAVAITDAFRALKPQLEVIKHS